MFSLIVTISLIFVLGLIMVFNTSSAESLDLSLSRNMHYVPAKQLFYALLGVVFSLFIWSVGYRNLLHLSFPLLVFFSFLLLLVIIPGVGKEVNGAKRWLGIGPYSFQPSEFIKLLIPLYYIYAITKYPEGKVPLNYLLKVLASLAVPIVFLMAEPDNGTVAIIGITLVVMIILSGVPFRYWGWPMLGLVGMLSLVASQFSYVIARLRVYLNPELDLLGRGHQPYQAKIAAGSGEIFGRGLGASLQKLSYLPEAQNDYIAAIYAEELGFIGILFLILLYMFIVYFGHAIALKAHDRRGMYVAVLITFLITFQAFLNLGVVSGLLPSTGMNLPFFSHGGSSLMANIIGISMLLNVAYQTKYGGKE